MVKGIFHVNVTDSERSLTFYELLDFRIVRDLGECGTEHLGHGLDFENPVGRAALLMIGDDRYTTRLYLIEWKHPPTAGTDIHTSTTQISTASRCGRVRCMKRTHNSKPRAYVSFPSRKS